MMGFFQKIGDWLNPKEDVVVANRPGRNEECWCGSGMKYKKCHLEEDEKKISKVLKANCDCKTG